MAQGFFVGRFRTPTMMWRFRAMTTMAWRMPKRIRFSVATEVQGPGPWRRVRSAKTAVERGEGAGVGGVGGGDGEVHLNMAVLATVRPPV